MRPSVRSIVIMARAGALAILLAAGFASCAQAAPGDKACRGLDFSTLRSTLAKCGPHLAFKAGEAKIVTVKKGAVRYKNTSRADENMCMETGKDGKLHRSRFCHCAYDVERLQLKGGARIDAEEHRQAGGFACAAEWSEVSRKIEAASVSPALVSLAVANLKYPQGGNGSCHGHHAFTTYDRATGKPYTLEAVAGADNYAALYEALVNDFVARYAYDKSSWSAHKIKESVRNYLAGEGLKNLGVYVENGAAWVNIDAFILSCADGNLFPVRVPDNLVAPGTAFYSRLKG